jgi:hypothetical protein
VAAVRQAFDGGVKFSEFVVYTSVSTTILVAVVFKSTEDGWGCTDQHTHLSRCRPPINDPQ